LLGRVAHEMAKIGATGVKRLPGLVCGGLVRKQLSWRQNQTVTSHRGDLMSSQEDRAAARDHRRRDPREAEVVLARLLPDESLRRAVVVILGESIDEAHRANPAAWEVTLNLERPLVRLNVGQVLVLSLQPENVLVALDKTALDQEARQRLKEVGAKGHRFNMLPDLRYFDLPAESLATLWQGIRASHRAALSKAGKGFTCTPFYRAHSPGVLEHLSRVLGRDLPSPTHATPQGRQQAIQDVVELVRKKYPGWTGFDDRRLVADEREYKLKTIEKTRLLLSRQELAGLLEGGGYEEFAARLEAVGKDNNLLFRGVPRAGDLGILYQETLNKSEFCRSVFDLLYGEGETVDRLGRYLAWVTAQGLPNKWTFPTYFLWACWPEREVFVKPTVASAAVKLLGSDLDVGLPSADTYVEFRALVFDLKEALASYGPRDATDLQSFLYVAVAQAAGGLVDPQKRSEIERLLEDFRTSYAGSEAGQRHRRLYATARKEARQSFKSIVEAAARGEDVTDAVLLKLLPHNNSSGNRERAAWISWAPAVTKDLKQWFEGSGWAKPGDWPRVSATLLRFLERVSASPEVLEEAWKDFDADCPAKGLQSGLLSPAMNALRPDAFLVVNNKSRRVINYISGKSFRQPFADYAEANRTGLALVEELQDLLTFDALEGLAPADVFDMFSHWLVAEKKFDFGKRRYWKIAPGEGARLWEDWRQKRIVSIGWNELGDLTGADRKTFDQPPRANNP